MTFLRSCKIRIQLSKLPEKNQYILGLDKETIFIFDGVGATLSLRPTGIII